MKRRFGAGGACGSSAAGGIAVAGAGSRRGCSRVMRFSAAAAPLRLRCGGEPESVAPAAVAVAAGEAGEGETRG